MGDASINVGDMPDDSEIKVDVSNIKFGPGEGGYYLGEKVDVQARDDKWYSGKIWDITEKYCIVHFPTKDGQGVEHPCSLQHIRRRHNPRVVEGGVKRKCSRGIQFGHYRRLSESDRVMERLAEQCHSARRKMSVQDLKDRLALLRKDFNNLIPLLGRWSQYCCKGCCVCSTSGVRSGMFSSSRPQRYMFPVGATEARKEEIKL